MGRTYKDSRGKRTRTIVLEVLKNDDGTYEIWFNQALVGSRVPERWLEHELCVRYGFCGEEYKDIVHQLEGSGKANVVL